MQLKNIIDSVKHMIVKRWGVVLLICGFSINLQAQDRYRNFLEELDRRDEAYIGAVENIEDRWDRFYESTVEDYYVYSEDGRIRRRVNFQDETLDQGFLEVTVVDAKSKKEAQAMIGRAIEEALRQRSGKKEILKNQVLLNGESLSSKNVRRKKDALENKIQTRTLQTKKGPKIVYAVKLKFTPDHLRKRASIYSPLVEKYARKYEVPTPLIFAVMHTESYFNPKAKSSVAYGLMQLVPKSGARDAYLKVFKRDKLVRPTYLYDPENNIRLGVAYLSILNQTFKPVKNEKSRIYLMISAYNTGAGNVSKAFTGKKNLKRAFSKIQQMPPDRVYNHLVRNLPYEETRHYIEKVNKRMPLYR